MLHDTVSKVPIHQEWILDETKLRETTSIENNKLKEVLRKVGIQLTILEQKSDPLKKQAFKEVFEDLTKYCIYESGSVKAYLSPRPYTKDHIWIVCSGYNEETRHSSPEMLKEIRKTRLLVTDFFKKKLGYDGYVLLWHYGGRDGRPEGQLYLEMIPKKELSDAEKLLDVKEKVACTGYVLFDINTSPPKKVSEVQKTKQIFAKFLKETDVQKLQSGNTSSNTLPWKRKWINIKETSDFCVETIYSILRSNGVLMRVKARGLPTDDIKCKEKVDGGTEAEGDFSIPATMIRETKSCAFCDPEKVKYQLVYSGKFMNLLYNYQPYIKRYHFLLTPKIERHVENWEDLRAEELDEAEAICSALEKVIQKKSGRKDVIKFVQNDPCAGQTLPHTHLHISVKPDPIEHHVHILMETQGDKQKSVSKEHMLEITATFGEALRSQLIK